MAKKRTIKLSTRKKIAESMKGNSNAEVWPQDVVIEVLEAMIDLLEKPYEVETSRIEEEKQIEGNSVVDENGDVTQESKGYTKNKVVKAFRKTHLKHELLMIFKIRNPKWFSYVAEKFKANEAVFNLLDYINLSCGVNTYNDAANGVTNASVAKMNLATHHNWSDRTESEVKHSGEVSIDKPDIPEHIRKAYEAAQTYVDDET